MLFVVFRKDCENTLLREKQINMSDIELLHRAVECLNFNNMEEFRHILRQARETYAHQEDLMGEILLLSVIGGEVCPEQILDALLRAERMIGGSSKILPPESRVVENHFDAFLIWGIEPGHADAICSRGAEIERIADVFRRLTGFGAGVMQCFQAQLAYYRGDFENALKYAAPSLSQKNPDGLIHLMQVYMLEVVAGVAKHSMNQKLYQKSYGRLRSLAEGELPASRSCREQAEVVCMMLEMSLGCLHEIPSWIRTGDLGVIPASHGYEIVSDRLLTSTLPSAMVAHVEYLSFNGEPIRALQMASLIQQVLGAHSVVLDAYVEFLRASCYFSLHKYNYAREAVRRAMQIIAPDGLWLIAAEFIPIMGEIIFAVAAELDSSAPEKIRGIGESYSDKLIPLRNEMLRGSAEGLTKREQQVMNLAMKGHSNSEIAAEMNVSVRTVRFHLENIYSKLNISRRSKFVSDIEQKGVYKLAHWVK